MTVVARYGKVNYRDRFQQEKDEFLLYGLAGHEGPAGRGSGEHRRVQPRDRGMPDLARILRLAGEPAPDQAEQRDAPRQEKVCTDLSSKIDKEYRYVSRRYTRNS